MLSHGIVSAALFLIVGVIYDRIHTREISAYGGLVNRMPRYAIIFMVFMMASIGLPGTSGFVGEFLILIGVFKVNSWAAMFAATGLILGAGSMLYLYRRVVFGILEKHNLKKILDINSREFLIFIPLLLIVFVMGIYPSLFLDAIHTSVDNLVDRYELALETAKR